MKNIHLTGVTTIQASVILSIVTAFLIIGTLGCINSEPPKKDRPRAWLPSGITADAGYYNGYRIAIFTDTNTGRKFFHYRDSMVVMPEN